MACRAHKPPNRFLLVYASQTGQAEAIAEDIAYEAPNFQLKADLFCMSLTDRRFTIEKETCAVFVVSTSGDGDPPDTAIKFFRRLSKTSLSSNYLEKLNFALLALGDSNYYRFCLFGRLLELRLKELSAKSFYPMGFGDDAYGIETGVDPWIQNLWPALCKQLGVPFVTRDTLRASASKFSANTDATFTSLLNNLKMSYGEEQSSKHTLLTDALWLILKDFDIGMCRIPRLPSPTLGVSFEKTLQNQIVFVPNESNLIFMAYPVVEATLINARKLTTGEDVKKTLELTLKFKEEKVRFKPGDSFGIICPNPSAEVEALLKRLNILHLADMPVSLHLVKDSIGKHSTELPSHIPHFLSLKDVLLHCVDLRSFPRKIFLRVLAEHTEKEEERKCLLFLSSQEASELYTDYIRKPSLSFLDILLHFKSCLPPIERVLEYLPALRPRFYSVASCPLDENSQFKILFNVVKICKGEGRMNEREGVCSGWLNSLSSEVQKASEFCPGNIADGISSLNLSCKEINVLIYKRQNRHFHFPENIDCPVVMVGPGTGIAPFIAFLKHRENIMKTQNLDSNFGESWLFYGCRYKDKDFLYKEELERFQSCGVLTHLKVSFSRETSSTCNNMTKYVHENIKQHAEGIVAAIKAEGKIFVCGDAKHMAHDVQTAFIEVFQSNLGLNPEEAKSFIEELQNDHRYIIDIWT